MHPFSFRRPAAAWLGALFAASAGSAAFGAAGTAAAPAASASQPASSADAALEAPLLIVSDTWIYLIDEPGIYLDRAREELVHARPLTAAANLRRAAASIDAEAVRADEKQWALLERDANTLLVLANLVEKGSVKDAAPLDKAFAMVRTDLGAYHAGEARESWARRDVAAAGRSLASAARYAKTALVSFGSDADAKLQRGLTEVEVYGRGLAERSKDAANVDWDRSRATLGNALQTLGQKIEPMRPR
jgi:hypothetical protein